MVVKICLYVLYMYIKYVHINETNFYIIQKNNDLESMKLLKKLLSKNCEGTKLNYNQMMVCLCTMMNISEEKKLSTP